MILGKTFDLKTFTYSRTAEKRGIDNTQMTDRQLARLQELHKLFVEIQQRLSVKFGKPIQINFTSVFRSLALNNAIPNSSKKSQHMDGEAADTTAIGISLENYYQALRDLARNGVLKFGQVIIEYDKRPDTEAGDWIHVSLPKPGILNDFKRSPITKKEGARVEGQRIYTSEPL
ncbi:MAG: D-Ala-D-Ala carboxypeptidase family metallohydrolase [Thermoplasmata archaeon]